MEGMLGVCTPCSSQPGWSRDDAGGESTMKKKWKSSIWAVTQRTKEDQGWEVFPWLRTEPKT